MGFKHVQCIYDSPWKVNNKLLRGIVKKEIEKERKKKRKEERKEGRKENLSWNQIAVHQPCMAWKVSNLNSLWKVDKGKLVLESNFDAGKLLNVDLRVFGACAIYFGATLGSWTMTCILCSLKLPCYAFELRSLALNLFDCLYISSCVWWKSDKPEHGQCCHGQCCIAFTIREYVIYNLFVWPLMNCYVVHLWRSLWTLLQNL